MKVLVRNYTFDASQKQIVFSDLTSIKLEEILLITNVTDNQIIYNFADSTSGGSVVGNVLTLDFNTTTMDDNDDLQIFIDVEDVPQATEEMQEAIANILLSMLKAGNYAKDSGDRMRIVMDNNPMLVSLMRNSYTALGASTEGWYSTQAHTVVDAREQLKATSDFAVLSTMQKWRI